MDPNQQPISPNIRPSFQLPRSWPGAFGAYTISSQLVKFNLSTFVFLFLISIFSSMLNIIPVLGPIAVIVLTVFVTVAICVTSYASMEGRKISLGESFRASKSYAWKMFLTLLLLVFIAAGTILLFIIPFFFIVPRLVLAPYLLVKNNLGARESLSQSWQLTKGNLGKVWGLIGVSILFGMLMIIIIGIYFSFMYQAAFALLTIFLLSQTGAQTAYAAPVSTAPGTFPAQDTNAYIQPTAQATFPTQAQNVPPATITGPQNIPPNQPLTFSPTPPQPQAPVQQPVTPVQAQPPQQPNQQ